MVLPGHLAGGYLITRAILDWSHANFSTSQTTALLIVGTLAGELPDIDVIYFSLVHFFEVRHAKARHRDYITHTPLFWLTLSLIVVTIGYIAASTFTVYIGWFILAGSWTHLLLDSIEYGVSWLAPFSKKRFALRYPIEGTSSYRPGSIAYYWEHISGSYKNISIYVEVFLTIVALYLALYR